MMKKFFKTAFTISIVFVFISATSVLLYSDENNSSAGVQGYPAPNKGCIAKRCHAGIAPIMSHDSKMAQRIYFFGQDSGDPNGCVVCHRGNPKEERNKNIAHKDLIRFPGSMWVLDKTCGQCHENHAYALQRNLMQTEAGKIQGAMWGWGAATGYAKKYGNYDIDDPDGAIPRFGSDTYKNYMSGLMKKYPHNFPAKLEKLPQADTATLKQNPQQAVYTYLRSECLRCHVGVRGAQRRGDYRGLGCAACHIPYSDEGYYEGVDKSIPKNEAGHILVHSIQSSRKTKLTVNGKTYSGIPNETCSSCHNRGKRIGVSYLGIIEAPYDTPFNPDGSGQRKLHGKKYAYIQDDVHHRLKSRDGNPTGGLLCQDCHTTIAVHGNGNIGGTTLGEVEVECTDCHGTPEKYPWELPIGYGDEFELEQNENPRGVATKLLDVQQKFSTIYETEDGYLLTARGNPFGNVVRQSDSVIVHSASGLDFNVPVLKKLNENNGWKNPKWAKTSMVQVKAHTKKMECYACHSTWAPQCYGCHVKVDYSKGLTSRDWVASGNAHFSNGETVETLNNGKEKYLAGKATEGRSYIRWEDPILGINGEGRVSPIIPGCQQITTVIGADGKTLVTNKIWRTPPGMENGGEQGQRGIDMAPAQPHTVSAEARTCPSCHTNPKTLGYGMNGGKYMNGYEKDSYADLRTGDGQVISSRSTVQFPAIADLPIDLSQVVTREGEQLQTVGHHWPLSGLLTQNQREKMERVGVCLSCHQDIPDGNLAMKAITTAGDVLGMTPHSDEEHIALLRSDINWAAATRLLIPLFFGLVLFGGIFYWKKRKKIFS